MDYKKFFNSLAGKKMANEAYRDQKSWQKRAVRFAEHKEKMTKNYMKGRALKNKMK